MIHFPNDLLTPLVTGSLLPNYSSTPQRLLVCPEGMPANFPHSEGFKKGKVRKKSQCLYHLVSERAHCHFSSILFARSEPLTTIHSKRGKIRLHHLTGELWKNLWAYFKTTKSTIHLLTSHLLPSTHLPPFLLVFLCSFSFSPSLPPSLSEGREGEKEKGRT